MDLSLVEPAEDKTGKRVRCGECQGCMGEDCGHCANCADKPKFGGAGIKKQACLARRCVHVKSSGESTLAPTPKKRAKPNPSLPTLSMMPAHHFGDFEEVDYDVDMQRALEPVPLAAAAAAAAAPNNKSPRAPKLPGSKKKSSLQRCGQCAPCTREDCGMCQNCADKPKFGGPGLRKQACEKKRCLAMMKRFDTPSPPEDAGLVKSDSPIGAEKFAAPMMTPLGGASPGYGGNARHVTAAAAWSEQFAELRRSAAPGGALPSLCMSMPFGLGASAADLPGLHRAIGGGMGLGGMSAPTAAAANLGNSSASFAAALGGGLGAGALANAFGATMLTGSAALALAPRKPVGVVMAHTAQAAAGEAASAFGLAAFGAPADYGLEPDGCEPLEEPAEEEEVPNCGEEDYKSWLADVF